MARPNLNMLALPQSEADFLGSLKALFDIGADEQSQAFDGIGLLHAAAMMDYEEAASRIIDLGADLSLPNHRSRSPLDSDMTPMRMALINGSHKVGALLADRLELNALDIDNLRRMSLHLEASDQAERPEAAARHRLFQAAIRSSPARREAAALASATLEPAQSSSPPRI